jgi:adenosine kinase
MFAASFFCNTDQSNAQLASFYPGAMNHAAELSFHALKEKPDWAVISPNAPDAMAQYPQECLELHIPYLYDPSQQIPRMSRDDLRRGVEGASALMVNDYEFELIKKHTGLSEAEILSNRQFTVVTRGKEGASIFVDGEEIQTPVVPPKQIADPTGVGDAFRGGFLTGFAHGMNWEICGRMGALAATYCLEHEGPQEHYYTVQEFIARFRKHFDDGGALDKLAH